MPAFSVKTVGVGSVCRFRFGRKAKRNGAFAVRLCLRLRVALFPVGQGGQTEVGGWEATLPSVECL